MLSILIPTYNYNVSLLVSAINKQATALNINFEIIVFEDGSKTYINSKLEHYNTQVIISEENNGRVHARQVLAEKANYNWLLFLDADVLPKDPLFLKKYLEYTKHKYKCIFGGIAYKEEKPSNEYILRWKYGMAKEQTPAEIRNKKPYKSINFGNFLIDKDTFKLLNGKITCNLYGEDNHFGALLKTNQYHITHIDNAVYHLGIDSSVKYLTKKEEAIISLLKLYGDTNYKSDNDLLNFFLLLKKLKLTYLFSGFYRGFNTTMKRHLTSKNPSINILQLYRISFMCYSESKIINA